MKTTLLLSDEAETVRPMLTEVTSGGVTVAESEAGAGCNCDRWGHPVRGVSSAINPRKPTLRFHQRLNSEVNRWTI
jgi:hypothetical protein